MSLQHAANHLQGAVLSLASSERGLQDRLQHAWDDHVQMIWIKKCLTLELLRDFKDLWEAYTAPSDDPRSTELRRLDPQELTAAIEALVDLATRTAVEASHPHDEDRLATLAALD